MSEAPSGTLRLAVRTSAAGSNAVGPGCSFSSSLMASIETAGTLRNQMKSIEISVFNGFFQLEIMALHSIRPGLPPNTTHKSRGCSGTAVHALSQENMSEDGPIGRDQWLEWLKVRNCH